MDLKDSEGLQARAAQYALPMQTAKVGRHRARKRRAPLTRRDLAAKGPATDEGDGFIRQLFLVLKTDGSWRPVINLKGLNSFVTTHHFKMESVRMIKAIMQREDWLLKLDLKHAYLSAPIHYDHQKYLRFRWDHRTWQFRALPFVSAVPLTLSQSC